MAVQAKGSARGGTRISWGNWDPRGGVDRFAILANTKVRRANKPLIYGAH